MLIKIISLMLCMTHIKTCDKKSCATCPKKNTCDKDKVVDLEELPIYVGNSKKATHTVNSPRSSSKDKVKEERS